MPVRPPAGPSPPPPSTKVSPRGARRRVAQTKSDHLDVLSALFTAVNDIERQLSAGTPVVVESYVARCLVIRQAFGAELAVTLPPIYRSR